MNQTHESILWDAFKAGDEQAFEQIYRQNYSSLFRYGRSLVHDEDLVRDAIQEMFLNLHKYRQGLKPVDIILPYLLASLKNTLFKEQSFLSKFDTFLPESSIEINFEISIEEVLILKELSEIQTQALNEALNNLPTRQREAIHLKFYEELSNQQIAEVMDINYQSVINFVQKALKNLDDSLKTNLLSQRLYSLFFPFQLFFPTKNYCHKGTKNQSFK
jgi:RNA polymerase sigma factor (sigma-70 family)